MAFLAELAPELLLMISDFLPLVDLCCFSVCSHRQYYLLSKKMSSSVFVTAKEKFSLLSRLERDIPQWFACSRCNLLHHYDGSESFGLSGFSPERNCPLPCVQIGPNPTHWFSAADTLVIHHMHTISIQRMSFLHLKLAMRRFYHGPKCGISTDSLSHTQVSEYPIRATTKKVIWLFSREAQVCTKPLGLYVRTQDILLLPEWRDLIDNNYMYTAGSDPLVLCPHDHELRERITPILWSLDDLDKQEKHWETCEIFARCAVCNTICDIELCDIGGKKGFVMTRWLNLGPGLHEDDLRWKVHTYSIFTRRQYCGFDPNYGMQEQCPKDRFEKTAPKSFKELRLRNLSYLRDGQ